MKMKRINLVLSAFFVLVIVLLVRNTGVEAAASATCNWMAVKGVNPDTNDNLYGVSATASNDAWAVGDYMNSTFERRTLIEHWDGTTWKKVASPNLGINTSLNAVAADALNDAWAVGTYTNASSVDLTMIVHWNGTNWSTVASPSPGSSFNDLFGVTVISANNIWAVGSRISSSGIQQTLIENWNGSQWQVVNSPNPDPNGDTLNGITATSATDIWAVGIQITPGSPLQTLIEHWNGTQWIVVSSPNLGSNGSELFGVTALSANNAWAVGGGNGVYTLIEHWDGTQWSIVSSPTATPNSGGYYTELSGIAAISRKDIWAVGISTFGINPVSIIEHWNGTKWSLVSHPNPGTSFAKFSAIAIAPGDSIMWAVGSKANSSGTNTVLIESRC